MSMHRTVYVGFVVGVLALAACGSKRMTPDEAMAVCPVIDAGIKACKAEFDKAWAAEAKDHEVFYTNTCKGRAVGYGIEHPDWLKKLDGCARLGLESPGSAGARSVAEGRRGVVIDDCSAFAACTAKTLAFK